MTMTASHAALLILWLAVLACLLAAFLGRRLLAPLARLAKVTTNFSDKLLRYQAIARPYSLVIDIEALAGTLRLMVDVLQRNIHEMQRTSETLELCVQEHTQQLLEAHTSLSIENTRLHEALEGRLTHLRTLMRLTQCMSSSLDIKDAGRYLCAEASGAIGTVGGYHKGVDPTGSHDTVDVLNRSTRDSYTQCHGNTDTARLRALPVCQCCVA